ncbi:MAG: hypothetical protein HY681_10605 [Chloroflexi bacterium]|nr:hypothetical protein [Chloroflexota bacterium]
MSRNVWPLSLSALFMTMALGACGFFLANRFLAVNLPPGAQAMSLFGVAYVQLFHAALAVALAGLSLFVSFGAGPSVSTMYRAFAATIIVLTAPSFLAQSSFPWPAVVSQDIRLTPGTSSAALLGAGAAEVALAAAGYALVEARLILHGLETRGADPGDLLASQRGLIGLQGGMLAILSAIVGLGAGIAFLTRAGFSALGNGHATFPLLLFLAPFVALLLAMALLFGRRHDPAGTL